ncbi:MAG: cysteine rich repeat-containing protein [Elusimicrobiota bacterium]|jgi:hypothetical protein
MNRKQLVAGTLMLAFVGMACLSQPGFTYTKGACRDDMEKLCPGVKGKESRQCLNQHEAELSAACKQNIAEVKERVKERADEVKKVCQADVQKFCSDVKPGEGRIVHCLKAHAPDLSAACRKEMGKNRKMMRPRQGDAATPPAPGTPPAEK